MAEQYTFDLITGQLCITVHNAVLPFDTLCGVAARANPKRGFLFVSKVLGKHWPATPLQLRQVHELLAAQLTALQSPCVFIGLAETATGLGQGVFEAVLRQQPALPALFMHTTRYPLAGFTTLTFNEPHCHAPAHYVHIPIAPAAHALFHQARELIVIDDEMSTGTTLLHLITAYRTVNPHLTRVTCVTLTDFSGDNRAEWFTQQLQLPVRCVSLLSGQFTFTPAAQLPTAAPLPAINSALPPVVITPHGGRIGTQQVYSLPLDHPPDMTDVLPGAAVLILGTGEIMHPALRLGSLLAAQGYTVHLQATTRSPILLDGAIQRRFIFPDHYGADVTHYLYNVDPTQYARIFICHETPVAYVAPVTEQLGPQCRYYDVGNDAAGNNSGRCHN